jgi:hypothetical protein
MATKIYDSKTLYLVDGTELYATPLKLKYLREFMARFEDVKQANSEDESIARLAICALVCMKQYCPSIKTIEELEDAIDMPTIYEVLDVAAGIKIRGDEEKTVQSQVEDNKGSWEDLDLAKLESEVFVLGIWRDYEELETSLSMPELVATLGAKRELAYEEKKFLAAIQGVDLDKNSGGGSEKNAWEEMKARVYSKGQAANADDVLALQGVNAQKAGFGIGMGLSYEKL